MDRVTRLLCLLRVTLLSSRTREELGPSTTDSFFTFSVGVDQNKRLCCVKRVISVGLTYENPSLHRVYLVQPTGVGR